MLETQEEDGGEVLGTHDEDGEQGQVLDGSQASGWEQVTDSVSGAESSGGSGQSWGQELSREVEGQACDHDQE